MREDFRNEEYDNKTEVVEGLLEQTRQEYTELIGEIVPEISKVKENIALLRTSLQKGKDPREYFLQFKDAAKELGKGKSKVPYLTREKIIKQDVSDQFALARDIKQGFLGYCSFTKEKINNQYRHIKNRLLPHATAERKVELESICTILKSVEATYNELYTFGLEQYDELVETMKNKKATIAYELMKIDPWGRYDKEQKEKAKDEVENGPKRDIRNALQYFGGSPIDKSDYGKCRLTDETIRRNEEIFKDLGEKALARSKDQKRGEIIRRDPATPIEVPDFSDMLIEAANMLANVKQDMKKIGIETTILDRENTK